jgi:DHA2 family multidrug resistance protein
MSRTSSAFHADAGAMARPADLTGAALWFAAVLLAVANFLAVLDTSIANVSVSNIAGGLGVSTSEGTWVITSYAVAEAIVVPLTGWLVSRFGTVRVFVTAIVSFAICSALCGMAWSLSSLVLFRVLQGMSGGPLMPLSQTLLMQIFPKRLQPVATTIWALTTIIGPILGPILGGVLCDSIGWESIFWVNVPIALIAAPIVWRMLHAYETPTQRSKVDGVGLSLLIIWVGALQCMLDLGKDRDWFSSGTIVALTIIALVGFIAFLIWELTEKNPIVSLAVFRHRGFTMSMVTLALAFGTFFATNVVTPLWLQTEMGYTATWAGFATAGFGVAALISAPIASGLSTKVDPRWLVFVGVFWLAIMCFFRAGSFTGMSFGQIAFLVFLTGFGMPMFFLPLTTTALGSVDPSEIASAAGLQNFIRTMAGAVGTSMVNTAWENGTTRNHADLVGVVNHASGVVATYVKQGFSHAQGIHSLENIVNEQAIMLSTNQLFMSCAVIFLIAGAAIWLSPKPKHAVDTSSVH